MTSKHDEDGSAIELFVTPFYILSMNRANRAHDPFLVCNLTRQMLTMSYFGDG